MSSSSVGLKVTSLDDFCFGTAPRPVRCGHGVSIGASEVIPEINFTLPPMSCTESTWPQVLSNYREMIAGVLLRAVRLQPPGLLVEFETLPDMTRRPPWGLEVCRLLADALAECYAQHGLKCALRFTPNDTREFSRPPRMRSGQYWDQMQAVFDGAGAAGADLLSIESTGGKEVCDEALLTADLTSILLALGVLASRDMEFLWTNIVESCTRQGIVPAGDTACGFANTAMVLADQNMIPRVLAAVVRVASVPRSLVAYEMGAKGPSKDCAYEGPYLKAMAGVPISMEGRSAACAHLSPVGNISQAVCDCWSNESVQNVALLSGPAPVASLEHLVYDCRLMDVASSRIEDARRLRDWLADSDAHRDPQAYVLRPDVVLQLSAEILTGKTPYERTVRAIAATISRLQQAWADDELPLTQREATWLDKLAAQAEQIPLDEQEFLEKTLPTIDPQRCLPAEYGL